MFSLFSFIININIRSGHKYFILYNHAECHQFSCLFIKCNYYCQDFVKNIWISNLRKLNGHPDSSSSSSGAESSSESDSTEDQDAKASDGKGIVESSEEVQDGNFVGTFNSDENSAASTSKDDTPVRAVNNEGISVETLDKDENPVEALNNDENSLWVLRSDANNPVEAASFLGCETNQRRGPWIDFEVINFFVRSSVEDDDDDEAGSSNQLHEGLDVERNVVHRQIPGNCLKQDNENFKFYFLLVYSFTFLQFFSVC